MRSKSRGFVAIKNADPQNSTSIKFNYLSHPDDLKDFRNAIRITRNILDQPTFKDYAGQEIQPKPTLKSDRELDEFINRVLSQRFTHVAPTKWGTLLIKKGL